MNNSIFALLFILLAGFNVNAQSEQIESLIDQAFDHMHDRSKADSLANRAYQLALAEQDYQRQYKALHTKGRILENHLEQDSAEVYYNKALLLAKKLDDKAFQAKILIDMAYVHEFKGDRPAAILSVEQSIKHYKTLKDSSKIGWTYNTLGYFHNNGGDHKNAIDNYLKALEYAELNNDTRLIPNTNQGIGIIYNKQNDFDQAKKYFNKAMRGFKETKDTLGMLSVHNDFGILNKNEGNFSEAEKHYFKMLEFAEGPGYQVIKQTVNNNLGTLYYKMKRYKKGETYSSIGSDLARSMKDKQAESDGLNYLAKNQLALGKSKEAIKNAERSLRLAKEAKVLEKERDVNLTLSEAYEQINQNDLALSYYKKHKILYDSIFNTAKTDQIHSLEQKYETVKKDKEIESLAQKVALDQVKKTRLWVLVGAALLLGIALFWIQWLRDRKEKEVELEKRKRVELENQRLNQELDFKKQELTSKVLQLCQKNEFLQSLDKQVQEFKLDLDGKGAQQADKLSRQISRDLDIDTNWSTFLKSFESVHPEFNRKLTEQYPKFSAGERRMSCLLKMNLGTKEIAHLLNITTEGVKKAKYRMRKKMTLDPEQNFAEYFMNLDTG